MITVIFFAILLAGIFLHKTKHEYSSYIVFSAILLIFIIGFREKHCFGDTIGYVLSYNTINNLSFSGISSYTQKDITFWYLAKIISDLFNGSYTAWFLVLAIAYICPICLIIKKYSNLPYFSFFLFFCLGFFSFALTGMRQTLALSFTTFSLIFI